MKEEVAYQNIKIGARHPVFIIAEAGLNHGGDLSLALQMIDEAAKAGADAIKFQAYDSEERFGNDADTLDLVKPAEFGKSHFVELISEAKKKNIHFFATPFDANQLEMLLSIGCDILKIASCDITNRPLLEAAASSGRMVIMSRGTADEREISEAIEIFTKKNSPLVLLHCVSSYPMADEDANLGAINTLKEKFKLPVGYSDHSKGIEVPEYAAAAGADAIEVHFTLDRSRQGIDWEISCEPSELSLLVKKARKIRSILGSGDLNPRPSEVEEIEYRKSLRMK